jgi:hypothetical protein
MRAGSVNIRQQLSSTARRVRGSLQVRAIYRDKNEQKEQPSAQSKRRPTNYGEVDARKTDHLTQSLHCAL